MTKNLKKGNLKKQSHRALFCYLLDVQKSYLDMPASEAEVKDFERIIDNTDIEIDRKMEERTTFVETDTSSTESHETMPLMPFIHSENDLLQNQTENSHKRNSKGFESSCNHNNDEEYAMTKIMDALEHLNTNPRSRITFIDFAGQSIYYAFHQIYLSPKTCYILVVDMTKGLDEKVNSDETVGSRFDSWTYKGNI